MLPFVAAEGGLYPEWFPHSELAPVQACQGAVHTRLLHCRRRTPPSSPQPNTAAAADPAPATPTGAGHYLRPAGPCTDSVQTVESSAAVLFRGEDVTRRNQGNSSSPVPESAAIRRLHPDQATCTGSEAEGAGRQSSHPSYTTSASPEAADANHWWSPDRSRRAEEEQGSRAPQQRGRKVSRRGRAARGTASYTAAAVTAFPSEQFGSARLCAPRYSCFVITVVPGVFCHSCFPAAIFVTEASHLYSFQGSCFCYSCRLIQSEQESNIARRRVFLSRHILVHCPSCCHPRASSCRRDYGSRGVLFSSPFACSCTCAKGTTVLVSSFTTAATASSSFSQSLQARSSRSCGKRTAG